jgi:hypothetical protein
MKPLCDAVARGELQERAAQPGLDRGRRLGGEIPPGEAHVLAVPEGGVFEGSGFELPAELKIGGRERWNVHLPAYTRGQGSGIRDQGSGSGIRV